MVRHGVMSWSCRSHNREATKKQHNDVAPFVHSDRRYENDTRPDDYTTKGEGIVLKRTCLATALAIALPSSVLAYDLEFNGTNFGTFNATLKAHHVVDSEDNGFDPSDGTAYMVALKYATPDFDGIKLRLGHYTSGDVFNLTSFDVDPTKERVARGMFINEDGDTDYQLGEIFIDYKSENLDFQMGRSMLDTPLTKIAYSLTPNFYSSAMATARPMKSLSLKAGVITEMSYGARAATDWGLIGEGTPTAGAARDPREEGPGGIQQGDFLEIGELVTGSSNQSNSEIFVVNATYKGFENLALSGWNYFSDDIANSMYFQADYSIPVKSLKSKLTLSGQYLRQRGEGDEITVNKNNPILNDDESLDYDMFGARIALGNKKWGIFAAGNTSDGDTYFFNGFGGDPAFTSTIFSRNAYRENVDAWKVGGRFSPFKGVKIIAQYADYGQSDTLGYGGRNLKSNTDAEEFNLIGIYKPRKDLTLRMFYAMRTSEYDDITDGSANGTPGGDDKEQSHIRFIAQYDF